jgi:nucleoside-diphosphate-sugar epimerase
VIPTIITQLLSGATELRLGSVTPTRDFTYVGDTVRGFVALAGADGAIGEEVNIATGREHSIEDVATVLIRELQPAARIVTDETRVRPDKSEVQRLVGDNAKLVRLTGWRAEYDLEAGLLETIRWFQEPAHLARYKAWLYNL